MGRWISATILALLIIAAIVIFNQPIREAYQAASTEPVGVTQPTETVVIATPTPAPQAASQNIIVESPAPDAIVGKDVTVKGSARVFENVVSVRLKNTRTKKVYKTTFTEAAAPDIGQFGPYSITLTVDENDAQNGDFLLLEVFQNSAKDGSEIDKVSVPLQYQES